MEHVLHVGVSVDLCDHWSVKSRTALGCVCACLHNEAKIVLKKKKKKKCVCVCGGGGGGGRGRKGVGLFFYFDLFVQIENHFVLSHV